MSDAVLRLAEETPVTSHPIQGAAIPPAARRNQTLKRAAVLAAVLALGACAAGSGDSAHAASGGMLSQFLLGLWHGIIGPFTLIGEVINRFLPNLLPWRVHLYETKAAGVAYDVGFYFGLAGGPSFAFGRRWR
jgi:hypothetical protein